MAQQDIAMGPNAAVSIGGNEFTITGGSARITQKEHDTNDSADPLFDNVRKSRERLMIDIEFQSEIVTNPHAFGIAAPPSTDEFIEVDFFPNGIGEPSYTSPLFSVTDFSITAPVKSGDPVTGRFSGGSSGAFTRPGDV